MGMLVGAVLLDLVSWRIPNIYIVLCSITSIYVLWEEMKVWGCTIFLIRFLWPILLLYGIYLIGGLGAGDVKLFAVISSMVESRIMIRLIIISIFIGAAYGVLRLFAKGQCVQRIKGMLYQGCSCLFYKQFSAFFQRNQKGERIHFTVCILLAWMWCVCKGGVI